MEQPKKRPDMHDVDERVQYVRESKASDKDAYENYIDEIHAFANGQGEKETREQFYPGWTDDDFKKLQERLTQEGLIPDS